MKKDKEDWENKAGTDGFCNGFRRCRQSLRLYDPLMEDCKECVAAARKETWYGYIIQDQ